MEENDELANLRREFEQLKSTLTGLQPSAAREGTGGMATAVAVDAVPASMDDDPSPADDSGAMSPSGEVESSSSGSAVAASTRGGRRLLAAAVVALVVGLGAVTAYLVVRPDRLPRNVAFRVNGHNVTVDELNDDVDTLTALYGVQVPTDATKLSAFRKDVAKSYAVSLILDRAAADRNIVIADKAAKDVLTRYVSQQYGDGSDAYDKFVQAMGNVGTSEAKITTELKRQLALTKLYNQITDGVSVTDTQVRSEFDAHKGELASPEMRELRNIVVATKEQADAIKTQLASHADFAALARTYSLDGSTKAKGGSLGKVAASTLDEAYAKLAFEVRSGAVFGPVQTQYGWNVGQVVSITPSAPAVFDNVKDNLKQQLLVKAQLDRWRDWLTQLIRNAHVLYAPDYRPADPDAAPSAGVGLSPSPSPK